jgi:hypothetical protein
MSRLLKGNERAELLELSDDWLPWRFQVNAFGDGKSYGYPDDRLIRVSMSNHETLKAAERAFNYY